MSEIPSSSSSSAPADDFIHVGLEEKISSGLTDSYNSRSQYSQVVFHDLSEVYPTDGDICFTYSFQPGVIPQNGDRIALYKVGWSSVAEFITSIFINPPEDGGLPKSNVVTFKVENLPKDEVNMYQFCYVTTGNIVAGSSIPFTFRKPLGSELVAVEDPNDSGLVVFRSRVTQLQEQLVKSNSDKDSLEKTINELKSELYLAKAELNEKIEKCELHKESLQDMTSVIYDLNSEKNTLLEKMKTLNDFENQVGQLEKNNTLQLEEIKKLQDLVDNQTEEIKIREATIEEHKEKMVRLEESLEVLNKALNSSEQTSRKTMSSLEGRLKEADNTISHFKSNIKEMEKSFEMKLQGLRDKYNEEKRLFETEVANLNNKLKESHENFDLLTTTLLENEEIGKVKAESLRTKLEEEKQQKNSFCAETMNLGKELEKSKEQIKKLEELLSSKERALRAILESGNDSNNADVINKILTVEDENSLLQVQLQSLLEKLDANEDSKLKLVGEIDELKEEKRSMAAQLLIMNEEIRRMKLAADPSQSGCSNSKQSEPQASSSQKSFPFSFPFFAPFQSGGVTVTASTAPMSSPCEKCIELLSKVETLRREKADLRSSLIQTKHENDQNAKLLKRQSEEDAALRSRIAVLEIELRQAKEASITKQGEQKFKNYMDTLSWGKTSDSMETSSEFRSVDSQIDIIKQLEQCIEKERETKIRVQLNVEHLMMEQAQSHATIDKLNKENSKISSENTKLNAEISQLKEHQSTLDELVKALDGMEMTKADLEKKLEANSFEKSRLETQLIELRKESVGKVSLNTVQELREENKTLKQQLIDKDSKMKTKDTSMPSWVIPSPSSFLQDSAPSNSNQIVCPICGIVYPPNSEEALTHHISNHLD